MLRSLRRTSLVSCGLLRRVVLSMLGSIGPKYVYESVCSISLPGYPPSVLRLPAPRSSPLFYPFHLFKTCCQGSSLIRTDDTDPKTSETSVVLLHNGTEVYVAPRPRHAANTPSEQKTISSTSSPGAGPSGAHQQTPSLQGNGKGKGKEKSVELRMIPQDVASAWGRPGMEEGVTLGSLERVIFCSDETRRRVRRKLGVGVDGAGPIYVSLTIGERAGEQGEAKEENEKPLDPKDETDGEMQAWLFVWDEMPDGHLVLAGKGYKEWSRWSKVR